MGAMLCPGFPCLLHTIDKLSSGSYEFVSRGKLQIMCEVDMVMWQLGFIPKDSSGWGGEEQGRGMSN